LFQDGLEARIGRLTVGTTVGPYEITAWLGAGGMGDVYRARDPRLGRDVAIKLIAGPFAADASRVHRFEQEARAAGRLNHPNILAIHDAGNSGGTPYLVTELLDGESLRARLERGAIPARKAVDVARQIAEGLAAAHDAGVVHRDVKPDNIFMTAEGRVKILDFGIAKLTLAGETGAVPGARTDTVPGAVIGSAGYMSPEQVRGEAVDERSDIFNVGTILYEMLTGRAAFRRDTRGDDGGGSEGRTDRQPARVGAARARADCVALPREGARRTVPVRSRSRVRARGPLRDADDRIVPVSASPAAGAP
jgi:serine/threonine protein kinase